MRNNESVKKGRRPIQYCAAAAGVMTVLLLSACSSSASEEKPAVQADAAKQVKVEQAKKDRVHNEEERIGEVQSSSQYDVVATAGGKVAKVLKSRLDDVKAGDLLIELDNTNAVLQKEKSEVSLELAEAQRVKSNTESASAKKELEVSLLRLESQRAEAMKRFRQAAGEEADQLQNELKAIMGEIQIAQTKLAALKSSSEQQYNDAQYKMAAIDLEASERTISDLRIAAPAEGTITSLPVKAGMNVEPGTIVAQIHDLTKMSIVLHVSLEDAERIEKLERLAFRIPGQSESMMADVAFVSPVSSGQTNTYEVELLADNNARELKPGMRVAIQLGASDQQQALFVPAASIVREGEKAYVFVLKQDQVHKSEVALGIKQGSMQAVEGIEEGDAVVVSGQYQLHDNDKVNAVTK